MTILFLKAQAEIRKFFPLVFCFLILAPFPVQAMPLSSFYRQPAISGSRIIQSGQAGAEWFSLWTEARKLAAGRRPQEATDRYLALLEIKKNFIRPRWELARLFISLEQDDKAAGQLEILLKIAPDDPRYLNGLGFVMARSGHAGRALELFQKAHAVDPENIRALAGICHVMESLGRVRESVPFLEKLSVLAPDDHDVRRRLAMTYYQLDLFEKSRPLAAALAAEPDATDGDRRLAARVYDALGLANISARYWREIIAHRPGDSEARRKLAFFCRKKGDFAAALDHLLVLRKNEPDNYDLLLETGQVYLALGRYDQAMKLMTEVIRHQPDNREALQAIVRIQAALGNEDETLAGIERYLAVEKNPSLASLRHAAALYDSLGRYPEAIRLYRRILNETPGDAGVIAALGRGLQAIGADAAALTMWRDLLATTTERRAIYLAMIGPLERLGRDDELVAVLEELRRLGAAKGEIGLKLALLYLEHGRRDQGKSLFAEISVPEAATAEFFLLRGKIYEKLGCQALALSAYDQALRLSPADLEAGLAALRLAGRLGLAARVNDDIGALRKAGRLMDWRVRLVAANARRDSGNDYQALLDYRTILDEEGRWNRDCARETCLNLARLYRERRCFFEAEQALRQALLLRHDQAPVYEKLLELSLAAGNDNGRQWLAEFRGFAEERKSQELLDRADFFEVRLLYAHGDYRAALARGRALLARFPACGPARLRLLRVIVNCELELDNEEAARQECERLARDYPGELLPLVLLEKVEMEAWAEEDARRTADRALVMAGRDNGLLLRLAELYGKCGLYDSMNRAATRARRKIPGSLRAVILAGRALAGMGRPSAALALYEQEFARFPAAGLLRQEAAALCILTGAYEQGIRLCDDILADEPQRPDIIILKARMLWAGRRWNESLALYRHYLARNVEDIFTKESRERGIALNFPRPEKKFWQLPGFGEDSRPDNLAALMAVSAAADPRQDRLNRLAVPLYALYCRQKSFSLELAARNSVRRREYFQAVKEFETLCRQNPADQTLLFDLAGIYSRLDRLGDEALIYEEIGGKNSDYPGLAEAAGRNRLKRRPRSSLSWHYGKKEGWNGYQAMERQAATASFNYSPLIRHQLDFSASRISYRSTDNSDKLSANRFLLSWRAGLFDWLNVFVGAGAEALEDGYNDTGLLQLAVKGKLGDKIRGHLDFSRDVVTDTTASLGRNVVAEKYSGGLAFDLFPRLLAGGDCRYVRYSDDNELDGYGFWVSSILFTEPTYLEFTYSYDFRDAREGAKPGYPLLADGFAADDHPYWAPGDYWYNRFRLYFKHLLSGDTLKRGTPTYYTAEYALDYDTNGHVIQNIRGSFFIEITPHIMLESRAELVSSDEIRNREFFVSAIYRW